MCPSLIRVFFNLMVRQRQGIVNWKFKLELGSLKSASMSYECSIWIQLVWWYESYHSYRRYKKQFGREDYLEYLGLIIKIQEFTRSLHYQYHCNAITRLIVLHWYHNIGWKHFEYLEKIISESTKHYTEKSSWLPLLFGLLTKEKDFTN